MRTVLKVAAVAAAVGVVVAFGRGLRSKMQDNGISLSGTAGEVKDWAASGASTVAGKVVGAKDVVVGKVRETLTTSR